MAFLYKTLVALGSLAFLGLLIYWESTGIKCIGFAWFPIIVCFLSVLTDVDDLSSVIKRAHKETKLIEKKNN
jgi:hypothetical protein